MLRLKFVIFICIGLLPLISFSQIRNGWRPVYDKSGRLSRMNYYQDGEMIIDSARYYQYLIENLPKAIVTGELDSKVGCLNGSISLFDERGMLTAYHIKRNGEMIFDTDCDYDGNCVSVWKEDFNEVSGSWICDSFTVSDGDFIIYNDESFKAAVFNPQVKVDLTQDFQIQLSVPINHNTAIQGIALGWKDQDNFLLIELMFGKYYSISQWRDGEKFDLTSGRHPIERIQDEVNQIMLSMKSNNLIVGINGNIQKVINKPELAGNKIALVSRSKGNAMFSDLTVQYTLPKNDAFFDKHWIGKGTGFFISSDGKILTTSESIIDCERLRIRGKINNEEFVLPVKVIRVEEENNLAVLKVEDENFKAFDEVPFGYENHSPLSDSKVFCIGYPNAISGVYMAPEVFEGKVLSGLPSSSGNRMLELDFRNGMIGAPVFDWNFSFLGICISKGIELKYTEMMDFYNNSKLFKANFGTMNSRIRSPHSEKTYDEKYAIGSQLVVIIEGCMFGGDDENFK